MLALLLGFEQRIHGSKLARGFAVFISARSNFIDRAVEGEGFGLVCWAAGSGVDASFWTGLPMALTAAVAGS